MIITWALIAWLAAVAAISTKTITSHRFAQTTHFAFPANQPDTFNGVERQSSIFSIRSIAAQIRGFGQRNINPSKRSSAQFCCPIFMGLLPFDSLKESAQPSFSCGFCVHHLKTLAFGNSQRKTTSGLLSPCCHLSNSLL